MLIIANSPETDTIPSNLVCNSSSKNETLNTANLHWYAPSIKELEEIISLAYNMEDEFNVFTTDYYWSCQPAYLRNEVAINYTASSIWIDRKTQIKWEGWKPITVITDTERPLNLNIYGSGPYLQDDILRARSSKYDIEEKKYATSSVTGTAYELNLNGSNNFGKSSPLNSYTTFAAWLIAKLATADPVWDSEKLEPTPTGNELKYDSGNQEREMLNRVRCIYNPNPPKSMTRSEDGTYTSSN